MKDLPEIEQDVLIFYDEEWRKGYREAYNEVRWHIYDYPTATIEGYYEWKHI